MLQNNLHFFSTLKPSWVFQRAKQAAASSSSSQEPTAHPAHHQQPLSQPWFKCCIKAGFWASANPPSFYWRGEDTALLFTNRKIHKIHNAFWLTKCNLSLSFAENHSSACLVTFKWKNTVVCCPTLSKEIWPCDVSYLYPCLAFLNPLGPNYGSY